MITPGHVALSCLWSSRRIKNGYTAPELDFAEGRSTGIPKILRAMRENGSPLPEFETDEDRAYFLIRLPVHPDAIGKDIESEGAQSNEIITSLIEGPLSISELVEALGLKSRTGSLKRTVKELLSQGLIEYTIPENPKSRSQKYRLTSKGSKYLEK